MDLVFIDYFNFELPLVRRKQSAFDIDELPGLWRVHWQLGGKTIISTFYTRIDQACILWGLICGAIFITAQFCPISWSVQALMWSALTLVGTVGMAALTKPWIYLAHFKWVLWCWATLMLVGLVITDLSIFLGWGEVLIRLCPLWLSLSALGYLYTGLRLRSRAFLLTALVHLLGILVLPYVLVWQFLITGIILGLSVLLLAELQWDSSGTCQNELVITQPIGPVTEPVKVQS